MPPAEAHEATRDTHEPAREAHEPAREAHEQTARPPSDGRRAAMAVLARADAADLDALWQVWAPKPPVEELRPPETGLVMVRGRIGGAGHRFNLGEATVTRASVRVGSGAVGHAYTLGRDDRKARLAAVFDALWCDPRSRAAVEARVIAPLRAAQEADAQHRWRQTAATEVNFFTMSRESGATTAGAGRSGTPR